MPIEIKEVIIKTIIDPGSSAKAVAPNSGGGSPKEAANEQALVDRIMLVLEDKKER